MKTFIITVALVSMATYTHLSSSMRSMADQPLAPTTPDHRTQEIQQTTATQRQKELVTPEHQGAVRTPAGMLPIATPLATMPDLEHDVHMITPHIGKSVPRDYALWSFD